MHSQAGLAGQRGARVTRVSRDAHGSGAHPPAKECPPRTGQQHPSAGTGTGRREREGLGRQGAAASGCCCGHETEAEEEGGQRGPRGRCLCGRGTHRERLGAPSRTMLEPQTPDAGSWEGPHAGGAPGGPDPSPEGTW